MIELPRDYIVTKFYEYGRSPYYNKFNGNYQCSCPICMESPKKKRCYYLPDTGIVYCHNCGSSLKAFNWIKEVSNCSSSDIIEEVRDYEVTIDVDAKEEPVTKVNTKTLPDDSINLSDKNQLDFYKHNNIIRATLHLIKSRRLDTAVNRPDNLYISLTDRVHKNRLVIPFVNELNVIEFYQTRTVLTRDNKIKPKYLGKVGSEKILFNINKIKQNIDNVYIFEGPINAFFTKNSIAVAGITERGKSFTYRQQQQLDTTLKLHNRIWILDSQWIDRASLIKTESLLQQGESVFIWPEKYGKKFKDFNDIAMHYNINEIKAHFIQSNTYRNIEGIVKLSAIKRYSIDQA